MAYWGYSVPVATLSEQRFTYDFNLMEEMAELVGGTRNIVRQLVEYRDTTAGGRAAHIDIRNDNGANTRGYLWTANGPEQNLPGRSNIVLDTWYTVEMEMDFDNNRTRARFGPQGGTPYAWTSWLPHAGELTMATGNVMVLANGGVAYDNFNMVVPEPCTAVLAALGLIGLLGCGARKRRAVRRS